MEDLKAEVSILRIEKELLRGLEEKEEGKKPVPGPEVGSDADAEVQGKEKKEGREATVKLWSGIIFVKCLYFRRTLVDLEKLNETKGKVVLLLEIWIHREMNEPNFLLVIFLSFDDLLLHTICTTPLPRSPTSTSYSLTSPPCISASLTPLPTLYFDRSLGVAANVGRTNLQTHNH